MCYLVHKVPGGNSGPESGGCIHRGVEWCLYGPQTPRETRDTRILRTTLHVRGPVNRAKTPSRAPVRAPNANNSNNKNRR